MSSGNVRLSAVKLGILALIAVSLFVVLARPLTRPKGQLNQAHGFTRWSLLAEDGTHAHAPLAPPVSTRIAAVVVAFATVGLCLRERVEGFCRTIPVRPRKIPSPRSSDSTSSD